MMQFFKRKAKSTGRVGIGLNAGQLAVAYVEDRDGLPYLVKRAWVDMESDKDLAKALPRVVKKLEIEEQQCSVVLNPNDYSLQLVEAPNVEPEELRAAVRWKVKDLLDMKIDEAAIDVFPVPDAAYRGRKMVYVVATKKSRVQQLARMVDESGLELAVIDIPELVMKNIATSYIDDDNGVAFLDLRRTGSTMNISRGGELFLTRRINTQMAPEIMQSPDWENVQDKLVLEVQRSLDYFESQMGQGQITRIVIGPRQHDTEQMVEALDQSLAANVSAMNLAEYMGSGEELNYPAQQICMGAIGACLRGAKRQTEAPAQAEPENKNETELVVEI